MAMGVNGKTEHQQATLGARRGATVVSRPRVDGRPPYAWALMLSSLPLLLFLLVPLAALLLRVPPATLLSKIVSPGVAQAVALSISTTLISTAIALVGGTPVAWLLGRREFRGRALLDTLLDLPMVLPPSVAGIALIAIIDNIRELRS